MSCRFCHFPVLVMIVCGQMKCTFAPNLGQRAAHLGGTVLRLLDEIYSSSSGVEASRFLNSNVLPSFKPVNASEWRGVVQVGAKIKKKEKRKKKKGARLFDHRRGGAKMGSCAVVLDMLNFLKIWDRRLVPRGTTSQVSSRPL